MSVKRTARGALRRVLALGRRRDVRRWTALLIAALAVLVVRVASASRSELQAGETALARGDLVVATVHLRRSAAWYFPGSPYVHRALRHLVTIAEQAEAKEDHPLALMAWRSTRAAILSGRSFFTPYPHVLDQSEAHIAYLMSTLEPPPIDAGKSPAPGPSRTPRTAGIAPSPAPWLDQPGMAWHRVLGGRHIWACPQPERRARPLATAGSGPLGQHGRRGFGGLCTGPAFRVSV